MNDPDTKLESANFTCGAKGSMCGHVIRREFRTRILSVRP